MMIKLLNYRERGRKNAVVIAVSPVQTVFCPLGLLLEYLVNIIVKAVLDLAVFW